MKLSPFLLLVTLPIWTALWHVCLSRMTGSRWPRQKVAAFAVLTMAVISTTGICFWEGASLNLIAFVALNTVALCHVYFHFFNMGETARRIRMLILLKKKQNLLLEDYHPKELVRIRLNRLVALNQLEIKDGHYGTKPTLLRFAARVITAYQGLLFRRS